MVHSRTRVDGAAPMRLAGSSRFAMGGSVAGTNGEVARCGVPSTITESKSRRNTSGNLVASEGIASHTHLWKASHVRIRHFAHEVACAERSSLPVLHELAANFSSTSGTRSASDSPRPSARPRIPTYASLSTCSPAEDAGAELPAIRWRRFDAVTMTDGRTGSAALRSPQVPPRASTARGSPPDGTRCSTRMRRPCRCGWVYTLQPRHKPW